MVPGTDQHGESGDPGHPDHGDGTRSFRLADFGFAFVQRGTADR
jgi:hypothetical protein